MPTSSPVFRGYLEYEVKRGKWSKRYVELREHGLWMSKRDSVSAPHIFIRLLNLFHPILDEGRNFPVQVVQF